jgi:hypothetical protein
VIAMARITEVWLTPKVSVSSCEMPIPRLLRPAPKDPHGGDFTVGDMAPRVGSGSGYGQGVDQHWDDVAAKVRTNAPNSVYLLEVAKRRWNKLPNPRAVAAKFVRDDLADL